MMKLKLYLRNLVKRGLLLNLCLVLSLNFGCSSSTTPTYLKENIDEAIQSISKAEYNIDVKAKFVGHTLWVYLPLEDIIEKADKPEKYLERFEIEHNKDEFKEGALKLTYLIKPVPEQEKYQELKYTKQTIDKINNVWKVIRRVLFSMRHSEQSGPQFFCLITADIKNGFQIKEIFYYLDVKKVSYEFISWTEYQHRTIQDMEILPQIIGDKEGHYLNYKDIPLEEFISGQIQQRIKLKFQKPEVDKNVDIDKEILKIVIHTIRTYEFMNFKEVELNNLLTHSKIILNRQAVWAKPVD